MKKFSYFRSRHWWHHYRHQDAGEAAGTGVGDHRHRPGLAAPLPAGMDLHLVREGMGVALELIRALGRMKSGNHGPAGQENALVHYY